jgi:hypothetical protein
LEVDFLSFVIASIEHGWLQAGNIFIVDNAAIHFSTSKSTSPSSQTQTEPM